MPLLIEHNLLAFGFKRIVVLAFFISSVMTESINACPLQLPTTAISINGHRLIVELAATSPTRSCGLSRRAALDVDHGMLFVYPRPKMRTFWMKDTWIPLSIAFLDGSGNIINIEHMSPDQTGRKYYSRVPAMYALEVNQGWFRRHGVKAGDRVEMKLPLLTTDAPQQ